MTNLKTQLPELNDNQFRLLHRLLDEVIGVDEHIYPDLHALTRNRLRAEQRQALNDLLGVGDMSNTHQQPNKEETQAEIDKIITDIVRKARFEGWTRGKRQSDTPDKYTLADETYVEVIAIEALAAIDRIVQAAEVDAKKAKDYAYWERNQLVGVLSRLYPSHLARHDDKDKTWEDDWRNIVCVHTPAGQATWHLHDSDMPMFEHLEHGADHWDGHTTEEKYKRIAELTKQAEVSL